jgi:hypothetical protein
MDGIAYQIGSWSTFFSAETSASAALTGLLFVSLSINLQQIVKSVPLVARAAKALATLTAVLVMSSLCLAPAQGTFLLGAEVGVVAVIAWVTTASLHRRAVNNNPYVSATARRMHITLAQASMAPIFIGAISLMVGRGGGLYWLVAGILFSFLAALLDAWVLLIEIQR